MQLLESFKVNLNEIHKLTEEQLKHFKQVFIDHPGHFIIDDLRKDKVEAFDQEISNHLISSILDILSKKLP